MTNVLSTDSVSEQISQAVNSIPTVTPDMLKKSLEAPAPPNLKSATLIGGAVTGGSASILGGLAWPLIQSMRSAHWLNWLPEAFDTTLTVALSGVLGSLALVAKKLYQVATFKFDKWYEKHGIPSD